MEFLLELAAERPWTAFALRLAAALAVAWLLHAVSYAVARRVTDRTDDVADSSAVRRSRSPALPVLLLLATQLVIASMPASERTLAITRHVLAIALIASISWLVVRVIGVIDDVILARYDIGARDNLEARRVHTQTRVLSRTAMIVVAFLGFAAVLMTFPSIRQVGASLLASAGIAGIVVGLAAQPTLGNLIAGLQIALTQPIRIDDVVIVDGEWGRVEEITATYVVVRIWDQRRLVVPLRRIIDQPFENWTRTSADILGTAFVHADYTVPIDEVREELQRLVRDHPAWDGRVCVLQVTDAGERSIELRALVSASDSGAAWDLRCHVREGLVDFLQRAHPETLPHDRAEISRIARTARAAPARR